MKKIKTLGIAVALVATLFSSCKKDDPAAVPAITTAGIAQEGKWKVALFSDSNDQTNHFSGYSFLFQSGGIMTATADSVTTSGTWNTGTDDSQRKFHIYFDSTSPLGELNNDWHVTSRTTTTIKLTDVSGGNGGTKQLTFQRF